MKKTLKKKRKPGRPVMDENTRRDKRLDDVRFSAGELARLKSVALKAGQRWSDWVRGRLGL